MTLFPHHRSVFQVEESQELAPRFGENRPIPVVTTDADSGEVLMMGVMNAEALRLSIETAEARGAPLSVTREPYCHWDRTPGRFRQAERNRPGARPPRITTASPYGRIGTVRDTLSGSGKSAA